MSAIQELTPALIGSTLTPIVVFLPLVFLGGITAVFFRALALTLVTALLASLFLAIFLTPVLARVFFLPPKIIAGLSIREAEQAGDVGPPDGGPEAADRARPDRCVGCVSSCSSLFNPQLLRFGAAARKCGRAARGAAGVGG